VALGHLHFFARFHGGSFSHFHGSGGPPGPIETWIGQFLLRLHDKLPDFLPEWAKWTLLLGLPVLVVAWLILKWQRWMSER
jgi:hypothetical protein